MTNDADLWHNPDGSLITPEQVLGKGKVPPDQGELRSAMRKAGYLPLYEGKKIWQFTEWADKRRVPVRYAPVDRWVPEDRGHKRLLGQVADTGQELPYQRERLGFRFIERNTDARTFIVCPLPKGVVCGHTMGVIEGGTNAPRFATAGAHVFPRLGEPHCLYAVRGASDRWPIAARRLRRGGFAPGLLHHVRRGRGQGARGQATR